MAPDGSFALQGIERATQGGAAHAEAFDKIAFRRQTVTGRIGSGRDQGSHLCDGICPMRYVWPCEHLPTSKLVDQFANLAEFNRIECGLQPICIDVE
jgi:hypothetical protein